MARPCREKSAWTSLCRVSHSPSWDREAQSATEEMSAQLSDRAVERHRTRKTEGTTGVSQAPPGQSPRQVDVLEDARVERGCGGALVGHQVARRINNDHLPRLDVADALKTKRPEGAALRGDAPLQKRGHISPLRAKPRKKGSASHGWIADALWRATGKSRMACGQWMGKTSDVRDVVDRYSTRDSHARTPTMNGVAMQRQRSGGLTLPLVEPLPRTAHAPPGPSR